jgi:hypothetical protein
MMTRGTFPLVAVPLLVVVSAIRVTLAVEPSAPEAQARYADLDGKPLQAFTNVDVGDYLSLRYRALSATGSLPDAADDVGFFAMKAMGQPFRLNASRFDYSESDCVVFVERCLAMALSADWDSYRMLSDRLRHKDGVVDYTSRNFTTLGDWVPNNTWLLQDITMDLGSVDDGSLMAFSYVVRPKLFRIEPLDPVTGVDKVFIGVDYASPKKTVTTQLAVPRARVPGVLEKLRTGDIALVLRRWDAPGKKSWFDCDHMGIVVRASDGSVNFVHAAPPRVRQDRLASFLDRFSFVAGMKFLRLQEGALERAHQAAMGSGASSPAGDPQAIDGLVGALRQRRVDSAGK